MSTDYSYMLIDQAYPSGAFIEWDIGTYKLIDFYAYFDATQKVFN